MPLLKDGYRVTAMMSLTNTKEADENTEKKVDKGNTGISKEGSQAIGHDVVNELQSIGDVNTSCDSGEQIVASRSGGVLDGQCFESEDFEFGNFEMPAVDVIRGNFDINSIRLLL